MRHHVHSSVLYGLSEEFKGRLEYLRACATIHVPAKSNVHLHSRLRSHIFEPGCQGGMHRAQTKL